MSSQSNDYHSSFRNSASFHGKANLSYSSSYSNGQNTSLSLLNNSNHNNSSSSHVSPKANLKNSNSSSSRYNLSSTHNLSSPSFSSHHPTGHREPGRSFSLQAKSSSKSTLNRNLSRERMIDRVRLTSKDKDSSSKGSSLKESALKGWKKSKEFLNDRSLSYSSKSTLKNTLSLGSSMFK